MKPPQASKPSIPAMGLFAGILAYLGRTGADNRQERIQERRKLKGKRGGRRHKGLRGWRKAKRLRKLARLARRKNRQVNA